MMDGGVSMAQVDRDKLSKWWLQNLKTKFEDVEAEKQLHLPVLFVELQFRVKINFINLSP